MVLVSAGLRDSGFVGENDGLQPVTNIEFREQVTDMASTSSFFGVSLRRKPLTPARMAS